MTFEEIEQLVAKSEPIPNERDLDVLFCYELLGALYVQYRSGRVDRETAKHKKQEIKSLYEQAQYKHTLYVNMYADFQKSLREAADARHKLGMAYKDGGSDKELLSLALKVIGLLTNDKDMEGRWMNGR